MILSRRKALQVGAGLGAAALFDSRSLFGLGQQQLPLLTKAIPSNGEQVPVIGLGSAGTFNLDASSLEAREPLEVVRLFHELEGTVIDTAPSYGRAEPFVGDAIQTIDAAEDLFLATKVNVQNEGVPAALDQMNESSDTLGKRTIDLILAMLALTVFSPLIGIVAVLIKLESRGPVIWKQTRIGKQARPFTVLKFRSMREDAEQIQEDLTHLNEAQGPLFKIRNDPRITRVGRFIRKFSIDEIPQLFNVIKGEMSLVGPQPHMQRRWPATRASRSANSTSCSG